MKTSLRRLFERSAVLSPARTSCLERCPPIIDARAKRDQIRTAVKAVQVKRTIAIIIGRDVGCALDDGAGQQFDTRRGAQGLGAERIDIQHHRRSVRGVRREGDHLPAEMSQRVEHLIGRNGVGRGRAAGDDSAGDVVAIFEVAAIMSRAESPFVAIG